MIALLRIVRLMAALQSTVTSKEFKDLRVFQSIATLVLDPDFFKYLFVMCRSLYAPMRVLRLADQKIPAMDKLYFYVRQTDRMLPIWLADAESRAKTLMTETNHRVMEDTTDAASLRCESEDDCEEEDEEDAESVVSTLSDVEEDTEKWPGDSLTHRVMRFWELRREPLIHDYSLVGHLLAPNPKIMADAKLSKCFQHEQAVERLITKLILDPHLVGSERETERSRLIHKFWVEHNQFWNKLGNFNRDHIWHAADDDEAFAYRWHKTYAVGITEVLGKLGGLVTSKILGIGTAERNWKQYKAVKSGQRALTSTLKSKKQVLIYGKYQQMNAQRRQANLSSAGKLWDDDDFKFCKMDPFCAEIVESLENDDWNSNSQLRIFRAWEETWEKEKLGPNGNPILEARLVRKYGGLTWLDPDNEFSRRTAHPEQMYFEKKRGNNNYHIFAVKDGYDFELAPDSQKELWDIWERSPDFFEQVCDYCNRDKSKKVKCYAQGVDCDSDEE